MTKQQKSALELVQTSIQLQGKHIDEIEKSVIPLLRESGGKIQRSEVIRMMLNILIAAVPYVDREAVARGDELEAVIVEAIVKANKNNQRR